MEIQLKLELNSKTLFLAMNIFDRYLEKNNVA